MEIETFYNVDGTAIAYIFDDEYVYLYDGAPVAFLNDGDIYAFTGRYLGWIQDGWVFGLDGRRVFFTEEATGGPVRPVRKVRPVRGVRKVRPVRGVRQIRPIKPTRTLNWSPRSDRSFFEA